MSTQMQMVIGVALLIGATTLSGIFLRLLRTRHPAVWKELGEPGLFRNNDLATHVRISKYLFLRKYRTLPNKRLVWIFEVLRIFEFLVILGFAYFCITAITFLFS